MSRSVGIDLGTTNSVISVLEGGQPHVLLNAEGARLTPSVVAFTESGELLVGELAKRQAVMNPSRTFRSFKRAMGSDVSFDVDGRTLTPQELSARVLLKLKDDAEAQLGVPVSEVSISVPAYFSDAARQATLEAGRIAGLEVLRLVPEPTAAALSFGLDRAGSGLALVFDLGGGTLDVSVLDLFEGRIEVRATSGDAALGGDDFDAALAGHLVGMVLEVSGVDVSDDLTAMQRIRDAAEQAKIELSSMQSTAISLPFLTSRDGEPVHFSTTLSRELFEELSAALVERIVGPVQQVLADAGVDGRTLDHVLLVGGSSRIPAVRQRLSRLLGGRTFSSEVNPDEAVSAGAALQSGVLSGEVKDVLVLDVTPLALGLETKGGLTFPLISRNTTIPVRRRELFTTDVDGQAAVPVRVVQGERVLSADNVLLGEFALSGIAPAPRGEAQIAVAFDIDVDGILQVTAEDLSSGESQTLVITGGSALPDDEVERMLADAETEFDSDRAARSVVMLRNQSDSLIYQATLLLSSPSAASAPVAGEVARAVEQLRFALAGSDLDLVEKRRSELQVRYQLLVQQDGTRSARSAADVDAELEELSALI